MAQGRADAVSITGGLGRGATIEHERSAGGGFHNL